jgi:hypothetical protein
MAFYKQIIGAGKLSSKEFQGFLFCVEGYSYIEPLKTG